MKASRRGDQSRLRHVLALLRLFCTRIQGHLIACTLFPLVWLVLCLTLEALTVEIHLGHGLDIFDLLLDLFL
jgi:hypothetical protein